MKKFRESENYNAIITVVLMALLVKLVQYAYFTVWQVIAWKMPVSDIFYSTGTGIIALPFVVLAMAFVRQAVKRNPKLMIGAIVSLAVVAVLGVSLGVVICMAACGYWLWMVTRAHKRPFMQYIKWAVIILVALVIVLELFGGILSMGYWSEWGSEASLEAGDWSEWETEEDMVYYDEEGNGATYETFEFE